MIPPIDNDDLDLPKRKTPVVKMRVYNRVGLLPRRPTIMWYVRDYGIHPWYGRIDLLTGDFEGDYDPMRLCG